jgi:TolB-like protein/class 3 adenylate cyclase/Tfp pilus assembly protein PilF
MAREQRRLAAIVAADVVGYSRMMGRDESGTLARLREHRKQRFEPTLARHGGRLVKLTGDGALAEFPSAVDAVSAAIEFQQAMAEANRDQPEETRIVFRIGLHLGDLIVDGDDLYGDGVNVAARLEAESLAGGVVVSGDVHNAVVGRVKATFKDLGRPALKNIERPVQAFGVRWNPADWKVSVPMTAASSIAASPTVDVPLALPDKPSIAVLPFQNMSGEPEQEYFADGIVEEIITALSRTKSLFVIARNSSFTYKGKAVDVKQVGRELGVRYVLEGSVRKSGNRVRITGQLIDADTGTHLWADRFDGPLDDVFQLQDQVTSSVITLIAPTVERAEIVRASYKPTEVLHAYDYYLQGLSHLYGFTKVANDEALACFYKAMTLDPKFAMPFARAAYCYQNRKAWAWSTDLAQDAVEAERLARIALKLDREDPRVLTFCGWVLAYIVGRIEEGTALLDLALRLDPNSTAGLNHRGWVAVMSGNDEAIAYFERALRSNPIDPMRFGSQAGMANAHFLAGRYEKAISWATKVLQHRPDVLQALLALMASHALAGNITDAKAAYEEYHKFHPAARISNMRDWTRPTDEVFNKFSAGLRLAGMPE